MIEIILGLIFSHLAVAYLVYLWCERAWSRTVILRGKQCRVVEDSYGLVYVQYPVEPGLSYRYELAGGGGAGYFGGGMGGGGGNSAIGGRG